MFFTTRQGTLLYYQYMEHPSPSAHTIVLIHGAGLDSSFWLPIVPLLQPHYSLLFYDWRGHGRSAPWDQTLGFDELADDLLGLMDALRIKRAVFCSHDMGSLLAERMMRSHAKRVDRLIAISPFVNFPLASLQQEYEYRLKLLSEDDPRSFAEAMTQQLLPRNASLQPYMPDRLASSLLQAAPVVHRSLLQAARAVKAVPYLAGLSQPIHLLSGEHDPLFPPVLAGITHTCFQTRSFLIIPRASRLPFVDEPAYSADWIHDSIQESSPPAALELSAALQLEISQQLSRIWEDVPLPPAQAKLKISGMGRFEVQLGDRSIPDGWNTRYAKSLLVYLAFQGSTTREELSEMLFAGVDSQRAMRNLRVYLSHFSTLLAPLPGEEAVLHLSRDLIRLTCPVEFDLAELLQSVGQTLTETDPARKRSRSRTLLSQWKGKILPGCSDPFSLSIREQMEEKWAELCLWAGEDCIQLGQDGEAVSFLLSGLQYNTSYETRFYDRLIEVFERTGNSRELRKWARKRLSVIPRSPGF